MANFVVLYLFINLSSKTKSNLYEMYGKKVAKAVIILLVLINPKVKKGFFEFHFSSQNPGMPFRALILLIYLFV